MQEHRANIRTASGEDLMQATNGQRLGAKFGNAGLKVPGTILSSWEGEKDGGPRSGSAPSGWRRGFQSADRRWYEPPPSTHSSLP